ncbi:MAG TPA: 30S ribosomal protein S13 [Patescibacteria group bacterium]|nr:30S ribosomal protein S13 [Patescibacteria group bacterium]
MSREFNYIVRIHGSNLDGTKTLPYSLCDLRGVGIRVARTMIKSLGLDPNLRMGTISEADVRRLEDILDNPTARGIPTWMLNRRKDVQTGQDLHVLGSDLALRQKDDIDVMRETRSWKGERHARGLKVRGQRTKTTARKGRSVGVSRSRIRQQQQ